MFKINDDLSVYVTRGDVCIISVKATKDGEPYTFEAGDTVRINVFAKKGCGSVALSKDVPVLAPTDTVDVYLGENDTRIGDVISKPVDYWYEIQLNPDTAPQTIIGYDDIGPKVFRLYPEGKDL